MNRNTQSIKPICSVILPVYNSERYLRDAVTSVLQQSMSQLELLAIDDASTDGSLAILQQFAAQDSRVRVIANQENQGVASVRNAGIQLAQGEYVAFLDSDDSWQMNKLQQQLLWMQQQRCDFSCTAYRMIDGNGLAIKERMIKIKQILLKDLLKENVVCCSSAMVRSAIARVHKMDGSYAHEDYVYWLELLQSGAKGFVLNQCLTNYRVLSTSRSGDKRKAAQGRWDVYRRYLGYGWLRSCWHFAQYAVNGWKKYR